MGITYIDVSVQVVPVTSLPETVCCGSAAAKLDARAATKSVVKCIVKLAFRRGYVFNIIYLQTNSD